MLAGFLERADPRDAWVHLDGNADRGAAGRRRRSARARRAAARSFARSIRTCASRTSAATSTRASTKLRAGLYDGAVLAAAGLTRLGRASEITSYFSIDEMLPAARTGHRRHRDAARRRAAIASRRSTTRRRALAAHCERGVLQKFGTLLDCYSAVAVHATFDGWRVTIRAFFASWKAIALDPRDARTGCDADAMS